MMYQGSARISPHPREAPIRHLGGPNSLKTTGNSMGGHSGSSGWGRMCRKPSAREGRAENHILRGISTSLLRLYSDPQSTLAPEGRLHAVLQNPEKAGQLFGAPTWIQEQEKLSFQDTGCIYLTCSQLCFPSSPFPHKPCTNLSGE